MTPWPTLNARANAAMMRAFGTAWTLKVRGAEHTITGVFQASRPKRGEGRLADRLIGGIQTHPMEPLLTVQTADVAPLGELANAVANREGQRYTIGKALADDSGLTDLELKEIFG